MKEIYKYIKGTQKRYKVSNFGNVLPKGAKRPMKPSPNKIGYYVTCLRVGGASKTISVHREVAIAFVPNIQNKKEVNHKDCNKSNNRSSNLEWVTRKENMEHARKSGRFLNNGKGRKGGNQILTENDVRAIRKIKSPCILNIAREYKVTYHCIYGVIKNISWKHIN